jgi:hypothetical protein
VTGGVGGGGGNQFFQRWAFELALTPRGGGGGGEVAEEVVMSTQSFDVNFYNKGVGELLLRMILKRLGLEIVLRPLHRCVGVWEWEWVFSHTYI